MSWAIVNRIVKRGGSTKVPPEGVRITSCGSDTKRQFISLSVGYLLAKDLGWSGDRVSIRIMLGTGSDRGKMALSADAAGAWEAKRGKHGDYRLFINSQSALGNFNFGFEPIKVLKPEIIPPATVGLPKRAAFDVPREFLTPPALASAQAA